MTSRRIQLFLLARMQRLTFVPLKIIGAYGHSVESRIILKIALVLMAFHRNVYRRIIEIVYTKAEYESFDRFMKRHEEYLDIKWNLKKAIEERDRIDHASDLG